MAMHVHASASQGTASMEAQLSQAAANGVDVLWWTEHDFRMAAHDAAQLIRCTGVTESTGGGATWRWTSSASGKVVSPQEVFCTKADHPKLGDHETALLLGVTAGGSGLAHFELSGQSTDDCNRTSLAGQTINVDVYPTQIHGSAFLSIDLTTSYRPRRADTPAGTYVLSYRLGGGRTPGSSVLAEPTQAVITVDAPIGRWTTLTLNPAEDLARLWGGLEGEDASLYEFALVAGAHGLGKNATGYFTNIKFSRNATGQRPLMTQRALMSDYVDAYPTVTQFQALEVSLTTPHLGWYGGDISLPDFSAFGPVASEDQSVATAAVRRIHDHHGLASYCHPFGTGTEAVSPAHQEQARAAKSTELVANRALGCDLVEVGYRLRGGCTLAQHESVWDNCSRNAIFLTGVGVNDDHQGVNWASEELNFVTWAWAPDQRKASLITALRAGRVYFGDVARFRGQLDIFLDGLPAMGTVSVVDSDHRALSIHASGIENGASVEVRRGVVDLAGAADTTPRISVQSIDIGKFGASGQKQVTVDTSASCFVRVVVKDENGLEIALSNPVWLLRTAPTGGIPAHRRRTK